MSGLYDARSNNFATALNDYTRGQNSIAQAQLEGMKSLAQGKEQMTDVETETGAQSLESQIATTAQSHMNKFMDEMGLDFSVQGLGKPLLKKTGDLLKGKSTRMRESGKTKQPGSRGDDGTEGTEIESRGPAPPTGEDEPSSIQETSFMDAEPKDVTGQAPTRTEADPEDKAPDQPVDEPEPARAEPEPLEERPALRGADPELDPVTKASVDAGEPIEVEAFSPSYAPIVRNVDPQPELRDDPGDVPEQPGLAGPGASEAPSVPSNIPDAPPSISESLSYVDESASTANPFSPFYRGDAPDAPGRLFQGDGPSVLRGPPKSQPDLPDIDYQFKAPIQPSRPFTKNGIDAANSAEADSGDVLGPMRQEIMNRRLRAQQADQADSGERGADQGADEFSAENLPSGAGGRVNPALQEEPRPIAPEQPPPPDQLPRGTIDADADTLQSTANQAVNQTSDAITKAGGQVDDAISSARSAMENQVSDISDQATKMAGDLSEKATSMLGDITGSDLLGGLGSFLGIAGDLLGPAMAIFGGVEAAKGIAEEQDPSDPYAKVRTLIAQGQAKMANLEGAISSDQFAEKLGSQAPAFGSLAAPVFSTEQMAGMSGHF
jgi:hypothetical protein